MSNKEKPLEIKCILLGEPGVGKTSIISRYVSDEFDSNVSTSSTVSYVCKLIEKNNKKIKLNIWDTIGQEKFRAISKMFLTDTKIVILVYSIISQDSFKNLDYWLNLYKDQLEESTILGVAANKSDLFLQQEVPDEKGIEYAEKNGAIFAIISARNNKASVDKFIDKLVDAYLSKNKNKNDDNKTIRITRKHIKKKEKNNKDGGCCSSSNNNKVRQRRYSSIIKNSNGCINSVFLGDKGVGKTSIIRRIKGEKVNQNEEHTETINKISINYNNNNDDYIKIYVYDVNIDKMKNREFIETIKNSTIFFLVYDVYDKESLNSLGYWIEVIKRCKEDEKEKYLLYIIGNKDDVAKDVEIEKIGDNVKYVKEGKEFSVSKNGVFKAVSARENRDIENIIGEGIENYLNMK